MGMTTFASRQNRKLKIIYCIKDVFERLNAAFHLWEKSLALRSF